MVTDQGLYKVERKWIVIDGGSFNFFFTFSGCCSISFFICYFFGKCMMYTYTLGVNL